ncbi:hypothetical protein [Roseomonas indoligenes]|uniref:Lipoprotein n=1 Tax=Roseomonas indoligenes TaxID=2820811 RepID=A0A940S9T9_9PROT|nr:hypothetical protein [Pararoseomonas indoligenes]MBP0495643.1 hypothetical protein [Pararoseomonas indoligenes]
MTALSGLRAPLLILLLTGCVPSGPDRAASEVLQQVLENHRATLAGLNTEPPPRTLPATGRGAPSGVSALLGQTREGVIAALGQPTRRRPEGEAEIWLYQGTHCALDVVLYRESSTPRVAWAAARASGTESRTEAGCLSELTSG